MKASARSTSHPSRHTEGDQHRLVGHILDNRLRVISLNHISPRQWLYQVEPPSVGKTRRALKVLGDPLSREPGAFYRLKTSYQRLKQINSPYIERVYECGLLHDLTPYIVVEWEPHQSLYEYLRLKRKPLSWLEAKPLFTGLCHALKTLHDQGLAHGDLRPQHILLRHPPTQPILIDSCINAAFGSQPVPGLERSSAFWAPERSSLSTASASSDLYSLGAVMYYCLCGTPPFNLKTSGFSTQEGSELHSPIRCIESAHNDLAPPELDVDCPAPVKTLIRSFLAKSARKRPTLTEALSALEPNGVHPAPAPTISLNDSKVEIEPKEAPSELSSLVLSTEDDFHFNKSNETPSNISPWLISALCCLAAICGLILAKL